MEVNILGTGSPITHPERAGTGIAVEVGNDIMLLDCGPNVMFRILESDLAIDEIEWLFFTHHHLDHNADFFHVAIRSWMLGRKALTVYGPPGTHELIRSFENVFSSDLEYRASLTNRPSTGVTDIETHRTTEGLVTETDEWRVTALPVEHSIETYAYRIEEFDTGSTFVFSGDTRKLPRLAEFATGADLLVHDAAIGPLGEIPEDDPLYHRYVDDFPMSEGMKSRLHDVHANASESAEVAEAANVEALALTHILPYRDEAQMKRDAEERFDGEVYVAEDGLQFTLR